MKNGDVYRVIMGELVKVEEGQGAEEEDPEAISECPHCGANIYGRVKDKRDLPIPEYTCNCRNEKIWYGGWWYQNWYPPVTWSVPTDWTYKYGSTGVISSDNANDCTITYSNSDIGPPSSTGIDLSKVD